jgi:hypothetical protein
MRTLSTICGREFLKVMEKSEKEVQPQAVSPDPSEHEGQTYELGVEVDEQGNGQLKRSLSRRLIHVCYIFLPF